MANWSDENAHANSKSLHFGHLNLDDANLQFEKPASVLLILLLSMLMSLLLVVFLMALSELCVAEDFLWLY